MGKLGLVLALVAPALCASSGDIDLSFADKAYQKIFGEDFSYDQRVSPYTYNQNEDKYFDVGNHGSRESLRIRIYKTDKTAWEGNPSCPRTELRARGNDDFVKSDTDYTAEWDWQWDQYQAPGIFTIAQLYGGAPTAAHPQGRAPNIFLRYGAHKKQGYNILCEQCSTKEHNVPGISIKNDLGKWIKWKIEVRLSKSSHGYLRFYHNGKKVYEYSGKTSDGSDHSWKQGLYTGGHGSPDGCKPTTAAAFLSNLKIRQTGSASEPTNVTLV